MSKALLLDLVEGLLLTVVCNLSDCNPSSSNDSADLVVTPDTFDTKIDGFLLNLENNSL